MEAKQQSSSALNDLIVINNDRCEGYRTAAKETEDAELKTLFNDFSAQSEKFATELRRFAGSDQPKKEETKKEEHKKDITGSEEVKPKAPKKKKKKVVLPFNVDAAIFVPTIAAPPASDGPEN